MLQSAASALPSSTALQIMPSIPTAQVSLGLPTRISVSAAFLGTISPTGKTSSTSFWSDGMRLLAAVLPDYRGFVYGMRFKAWAGATHRLFCRTNTTASPGLQHRLTSTPALSQSSSSVLPVLLNATALISCSGCQLIILHTLRLFHWATHGTLVCTIS